MSVRGIEDEEEEEEEGKHWDVIRLEGGAMSTITTEEPYVAVVDGSLLNSVCSHCFERSEFEKPFKRCNRCKVLHYCSQNCQREDWKIHKDECPWLVDVAPNVPQSKARLMGRLLIRRFRGEATSVKAFNGRCFDDLMDHVDEIRTSSEHLPLFTSLCYGLKLYVGDQFMVGTPELLRYFGRAVINSFGITLDDQITVGEGIYLGLSALNHSCAPDAFVRFHGRKAILRAADPTIKKFSTQLTIPYTNLDTLASERRSTLKKQYFFTCNCRNCLDKDRDGYARSIICPECTMGVCLVLDSSKVLTCDKCGAVNAISVDEAIRMNQEVEWQLEKNKVVASDTWTNLSSDVQMHKKYVKILSRYNISLAALAIRIINLAMSINRIDVALDHAYFIEYAYKRYLPMGHPMLTWALLTAVLGASCEDPPSGRVMVLMGEAQEACLISHGPTDPVTLRVNEQVRLYRNKIQNYRDKNFVLTAM